MTRSNKPSARLSDRQSRDGLPTDPQRQIKRSGRGKGNWGEVGEVYEEVYEEVYTGKDERKNDKVIVFCNMKRTCDVIESFLVDSGFSAAAIHGDKTQQERDWVLNELRAGRAPVMIATDVASRGLGNVVRCLFVCLLFIVGRRYAARAPTNGGDIT